MKQRAVSPSPGYLIINKNALMYYITDGLHRRIFMKINTIFNTHVLY